MLKQEQGWWLPGVGQQVFSVKVLTHIQECKSLVGELTLGPYKMTCRVKEKIVLFVLYVRVVDECVRIECFLERKK